MCLCVGLLLLPLLQDASIFLLLLFDSRPLPLSLTVQRERYPTHYHVIGTDFNFDPQSHTRESRDERRKEREREPVCDDVPTVFPDDHLRDLFSLLVSLARVSCLSCGGMCLMPLPQSQSDDDDDAKERERSDRYSESST